MVNRWLFLLLALPLPAQDAPGFPSRDHGWGMALGTGFSALPVVIDVHYTFRPGVGFYLGGGGTPHSSSNDFSFNINFDDRGTLRKVQTAAHAGIAVTLHPQFAWGLGYGRHTESWEIDHSGWFTAEEEARLNTAVTRTGPQGWVAFYPGRVLGFQVQAGPGWGGVSLAIRFR
jgi:hypothetical protein